MRTGAQIIVDSLVEEGVSVMFGYPGGAVIDIFDCLNRSSIEFILTRHEQGAAHAADGYARATGKPGMCIATSGPGATNLVTGLATANMDSVPVIAITGQVPSSMIGNDAFQEADVTGITRPVTKHNYLVKDIHELPRIIKEAFYIATTGRPGPVLIDIPKDIQKATTSAKYPKEISMRSYNPKITGHKKQIEKAARIIKDSKRPVIYAGGGVIASRAAKELNEFANKAKIPVTTTLLGLGAFDENNPLSLKMLGMHGTVYANYAIMESDLIIAVGARFDDRVTGNVKEFAPYAKIIHIDIDPTAISKSVKVDVPIVGDAKNVLKELASLVDQGDWAPWLEKVAGWKKEYPLTYGDEGDLIKPQYVVEQIYEATKGDAIITTEVGQNQMWAAQYYKYKEPNTFLSSGGLGTMGYGFPAAIGARMGRPDKTVVDIAGDGSIQMNIQELATAVLNKLPIKIIILNNGYLGMVRQWQDLFYGKNYAYTCLIRAGVCDKECKSDEHCPVYIPDFVKLAEAYSAVGMRVTRKEDVRPALEKALSTDNVVIAEFVVSREENVFPMVPAGASIRQMIGGMA